MANWFTNLFTTPTTNRIGGTKKHWNCRGSDNYIAHSGQVFGDNTRLGIKLVYDSLQRRNQTKKLSKGATYFKTEDFKYAEFESNVLWLLGVIIDTENTNWNPKEKGKSKKTKAYGYYQIINKDFIQTANNRFKAEINKFNNHQSKLWEKEDHTFGKTLERPKWSLDIEKDLKNPNLTHYDIVDKYHADIFGCLVLCTMLVAGKDKDWLNLLTDRVNSAKLLYYRGHHADKKYVGKDDSDLLSMGGVVDLAVWYNVEKNIKCDKPHAASFKTKKNQLAKYYKPNNTCNVSGDSKVIQEIADVMIDGLDIGTGEDWAKEGIKNFNRANDVTHEFSKNLKPTDIVNLTYSYNFKLGEVWRSERGTNDKVYYMFDILPNNSQSTIEDTLKDIIKSEVRRKANPDELLKSVTKTFGNIKDHKAYMAGVMVRHKEEPVWFPTFMDPIEKPSDISKPVLNDIGLLNGNVQVMYDERHKVAELNAGKTVSNSADIIRYYPGDYDIVKQELSKPNPTIKFKLSGKWELSNSKGLFSSVKDLDPLEKGLKYYYNNLTWSTLSRDMANGDKAENLLAGFWNHTNDTTNITLYTNDDYAQTLIHEIGSHKWLDAKGGHGEDVLFSTADIKHTKDIISNPYREYNKLATAYNNSNHAPGSLEEAAAWNKMEEVRVIIEDDIISRNFINVSSYGFDHFEDEFIARLVGTMSIYKCITYEHDIYPKLKKLGLNHSIELVRGLDKFMKDEFLLTERQYGDYSIIPTTKSSPIDPSKDPYSTYYDSYPEGYILEDKSVIDLGKISPRTTDQMAHIYVTIAYVRMGSAISARVARGSIINAMMNDPAYSGDHNMTMSRISKAIGATAKQRGVSFDHSVTILEYEMNSAVGIIDSGNAPMDITNTFIRVKIGPQLDQWGWVGWNGYGEFGVYEKK